MKTMILILLIAGAGLFRNALGQEVLNLRETWDNNARGWSERDAGDELAISWELDPTLRWGGYLLGVCTNQAVPFPDTNAFVAELGASNGKYVGDLTAYGFNLDRYQFDLKVSRGRPSVVLVRLEESGGGARYFRDVSSLVTSPGLHRVSVPLQFDSQWIGGTALAFSNLLQNLGRIQVQVTRGTAKEQKIELDNFLLSMQVPAGVAAQDTDGDDLPDYWESMFGGDPTNMVATVDEEGDRTNNLDEYRAGTDPLLSGSVPRIDNISYSGSLDVRIDSVAGRTYQLEINNGFPLGSWAAIGSSVSGDGSYKTIHLASPASEDGLLRLRITFP